MPRPSFTYFLSGLIFSLTVRFAYAAPVVRPGDVWLDNRGVPVQAHGGGVTMVSGTYYWFGEDRSRDNDPHKRYVACYSSADLVHWTFRHKVAQFSDPEHLGPGWVLERPKVFFNAATKQYVMYMHIDGRLPGTKADYSFARVGVAVCDKVDGDYQYVHSFRPLGKESRDIGQFVDDDGSAYLIFESRPTKGFFIAGLSRDYLNVDRAVSFVAAPLEGGALVHYQGLYYCVGSHLTGWSPNPNVYATASKITGPWSAFQNIAPPQTDTYHSQSTFLLKVTGTKTTTVIFMGDIWEPRTLWDSRYLWMPLQIGNGKAWLPAPQPWSIDARTGEAAIPPAHH